MVPLIPSIRVVEETVSKKRVFIILHHSAYGADGGMMKKARCIFHLLRKIERCARVVA